MQSKSNPLEWDEDGYEYDFSVLRKAADEFHRAARQINVGAGIDWNTVRADVYREFLGYVPSPLHCNAVIAPSALLDLRRGLANVLDNVADHSDPNRIYQIGRVDRVAVCPRRKRKAREKLPKWDLWETRDFHRIVYGTCANLVAIFQVTDTNRSDLDEFLISRRATNTS